MDNDVARQRLESERTRLEAVVEQIHDETGDEGTDDAVSELAGGLDQHQADVGTETFEREKDLSILERVEGELADVEHALKRLDEGTYGTCEACGKPIGEERLEAMPAARVCVDDQALAERDARAGSTEDRPGL